MNRELIGSRSGVPLARLLLIDDDRELAELLTRYLGKENLDVEVAEDGEKGLKRVFSEPFDLVILDVMLPGIHGVEVLRRIRAKSQIPVLMLTARFEEVDRIVGLEVGADDYLGKPFNPRELVARIHAVLRRFRMTTLEHSPPVKPEPLNVGDLLIDRATRSALRGGTPVELTTVEFDLLEKLVRSAGNVVNREEISKEVLGRELMPLDRSIDMHICQLRKKLGPLEGDQERIITIRGVGYLYSYPTGETEAASSCPSV